jgi:glycosyltransferase involved in cell wall biosynthesis
LKAVFTLLLLNKKFSSVVSAPGTELSTSSKVVFISSCPEAWGGSEELWSKASICLKQKGFQVKAFKTYIEQNHNRIIALRNAGIEIEDIYSLSLTRLLGSVNKVNARLSAQIPDRISLVFKGLQRINFFISKVYKSLRIRDYLSMLFLGGSLAGYKPDLVVISQGENFDGLAYMCLCQSLKLNYVILSQKAADHYWPSDEIWSLLQDGYQNAQACFFVSQHNLQLTETQLGQRLPHAEVVKNPHQATIAEPLAWPSPEGDYNLACVARLWILDKGQDILLNVLAQTKWQERNLKVTFFGNGSNYNALVKMAELLQIKNVSFPGFSKNIIELWQDYHALIMPSRAEGLPLALVEAMMCGRPAIATAVGGIPEVLEDDVTGFIAKGACFAAVDEAMERAWQRRHEWEAMGKQAAISIREITPPHPEELFAEKLLKLCQI